MMFSSAMRILVLVVLAWVQLVVVESHMCLQDPMQRLQTGMPMVDCGQNGTAPCGPDFPDTPSPNATVITAGSTYTVTLYLPMQHHMHDVPENITISIGKDVTDTFLKLGEWPDYPGDYLTYDVQIPSNLTGHYLLQANYNPENHDFYSCADIEVQASVVG